MYMRRVQDFATGKNFSFNQCSKHESFAFFLGKVISIKAIENVFLDNNANLRRSQGFA